MTQSIAKWGVCAGLAICAMTSTLPAQDLLSLAASISGASAEVQKAKADVDAKRDEAAQEAKEVAAAEEKVAELKAAAAEGAAPEGPFILFMGQYSNTRGSKHGEFDNFADARAKGRAHLSENSTKQPNYRITDKNGTDLEYQGLFGNKTFDAGRLNRPKNNDGGKALGAAVEALAARVQSYRTKQQAYVTAKASYDKQLAQYNADVARLNQALPEAIRDAGTGTPTAADLEAPAGDFGVERLVVVDEEYKGKTVKDGDALSFVKEAAKLPDPTEWTKKDKVFGGKIRTGTAIATFNEEGVHKPGPGAHSALFITQNKKGIWVYDQYKTADGKQRPVAKRFIHNHPIKGSAANSAGSYFAIGKK